MIPSWTNLVLLAFESQQAMLLRIVRLAAGGPASQVEAARMVSEKIEAADAAARAAMGGASANKIVRTYRRKVRANIKRLSRKK